MPHRHNPEKGLLNIVQRYEGSVSSPANVTQISYHAKVVDIEDPKNSRRIKARIPGVDDGKTDGDLPWCISSTPGFLFWLPQAGEHVIIMLSNPWNTNVGRLYFGPIQTGNNTDNISFEQTMIDLGMRSYNEE